MEIWKDIIETNNKYSISNYGKVKKNKEYIIRSNNRSQLLKEKILTPVENAYGYLKVRFSLGNYKVINKTVHSLVAKYFIEKKDNSLQVNHKNGNKKDNHVDNLEWVTSKENIRHAWEKGLSTVHSNKVIYIDNIEFKSLLEASKFLNVNRNTISKSLIKGKYSSKKHKVEYNGKIYNSLREAGKAEKLNPKTIEKYGKVILPKIYVLKYKNI